MGTALLLYNATVTTGKVVSSWPAEIQVQYIYLWGTVTYYITCVQYIRTCTRRFYVCALNKSLTLPADVPFMDLCIEAFLLQVVLHICLHVVSAGTFNYNYYLHTRVISTTMYMITLCFVNM